MKKILNIVTSLKEDKSFSVKLSNAILDKITAVYPDSQVVTRNVAKAPFPHLDGLHVGAFYTPGDAQTAEQKKAIKHSDEAIKELTDADIIVIGVPLYNFSIPSTLKAWIDHIVRSGATFQVKDGVPKGLLINKKVYLAIASGFVYSEGPMKSYDFTENYIRKVLGFIGLTDITVFRIEGMNIPEFKDIAEPKALNIVNEFSY